VDAVLDFLANDAYACKHRHFLYAIDPEALSSDAAGVSKRLSAAWDALKAFVDAAKAAELNDPHSYRTTECGWDPRQVDAFESTFRTEIATRLRSAQALARGRGRRIDFRRYWLIDQALVAMRKHGIQIDPYNAEIDSILSIQARSAGVRPVKDLPSMIDAILQDWKTSEARGYRALMTIELESDSPQAAILPGHGARVSPRRPRHRIIRAVK
jgi:hypothetical protein